VTTDPKIVEIARRGRAWAPFGYDGPYHEPAAEERTGACQALCGATIQKHDHPNTSDHAHT
jgi:hypothetical protein